MLGSPKTALSTLPRKTTANHAEEEKRERPEQRFKLKIGSLLMKPKVVRMSESTLMKNTADPNSKPTISPLTENNSGKIANIPPSKHTLRSNRIIILPEGRVNNDEYRSTSLSMYLSNDLLDAK